MIAYYAYIYDKDTTCSPVFAVEVRAENYGDAFKIASHHKIVKTFLKKSETGKLYLKVLDKKIDRS